MLSPERRETIARQLREDRERAERETAEGGKAQSEEENSSKTRVFDLSEPEYVKPDARQGDYTPTPERAMEPTFRRVPPQNIAAEKSLLGAIILEPSIVGEVSRVIVASDFYYESHREIFRAMQRSAEAHNEIDAVTLAYELKLHGKLDAVGGAGYLAELAEFVPTSLNAARYAEIVKECAVKRQIIRNAVQLMETAYNGSTLPELQTQSQKVAPINLVSGSAAIVMETQDQSIVINEEYLARPEIIEGLGYSQGIMLIIGGKHSGKTTNLRTLALSVPRGLPIWGRQTSRGPVIYAASDDEIVSTRNELLQMGWSQSDPLYLARIAPESDGTGVLTAIGDEAIRRGATMIIVDMLFDFVGIRDELSYAQTRDAINELQHLADRTRSLVVASHHTPKYLYDIHNAANAALGSQGISARFSPIILIRKWTEHLFTAESTTTRDPRGKILEPIKVTRNAEGWIEPAGVFKEYMKWEIYADRVLDLFKNAQQGLSVYSVAEKLGIDRPKAQNTLKEMESAGKLRREKVNRKYLYFLPNSDMFAREGGNWNQDEN